MRYMLLIYSDESGLSETEIASEYQGYMDFGEEAERRGFAPVSHQLQPVSTATTVQVSEGKTLTTDGPFAETKEQLGGYYILNCKNLDEAIEMAAKIPAAPHGSIEIRPLVERE